MAVERKIQDEDPIPTASAVDLRESLARPISPKVRLTGRVLRALLTGETEGDDPVLDVPKVANVAEKLSSTVVQFPTLRQSEAPDKS